MKKGQRQPGDPCKLRLRETTNGSKLQIARHNIHQGHIQPEGRVVRNLHGTVDAELADSISIPTVPCSLVEIGNEWLLGMPFPPPADTMHTVTPTRAYIYRQESKRQRVFLTAMAPTSRRLSRTALYTPTLRPVERRARSLHRFPNTSNNKTTFPPSTRTRTPSHTTQPCPTTLTPVQQYR